MIKKKFALFVSGYGRAAIQIMKDYRNGLIEPQLSLLVSSNPLSESLNFASSNKIPSSIIDKNKFETKFEFETEILSLLCKHKIDYIFLSGWMPIVGSTLLKKYSKKIINIHPSLLPSFKGLNAIDQAIEYGVKVTGITTHYVEDNVDTGKIVDQVPIIISENDNFEAIDIKIFKAGCSLAKNTINKIFI